MKKNMDDEKTKKETRLAEAQLKKTRPEGTRPEEARLTEKSQILEPPAHRTLLEQKIKTRFVEGTPEGIIEEIFLEELNKK